MNNSDFDYSFQYGVWHADNPESRARDIALAKSIFDAHGIYPDSARPAEKILEIGCGMGRFMLMLRAAGWADLTGVDIDRSQIEIAKRENLNAHLSDAEDFLEKSGETYDVIYAFDVLEHIAKEQQLRLLKLMREHLSENGFIVIQVPNAMAPLQGFYRYSDFTHTVSYTDITLRFLLRNSGFHHIATRPCHQECAAVQELKMPWARLYRTEFGLKDFILTPNIVAVAFKNQERHDRWLNNAPIIANEYPEPVAAAREPRNWRRLWRHIKTMNF